MVAVKSALKRVFPHNKCEEEPIMNEIDIQTTPPSWLAQFLLSPVPFTITLSGIGILVAYHPKEKTS